MSETTEITERMPRVVMGIPQHEYSAMFPQMPEDEFMDLSRSIARDGLLEKIILFRDAEGNVSVVDGIHRLQACEDCGVVPEFEETGHPERVARTKNLYRRNIGKELRTQLHHKLLEAERKRNGDGRRVTERELAQAAGVSKTTAHNAITRNNGGDPKPKPEPAEEPELEMKPEPKPERERRKSQVEQLEDIIESQELQISELENEKAALEERLGLLGEVERGLGVTETKTYERMRKSVVTLRDEKAGLQRENRKKDAHIKGLEKENARLERILRDAWDHDPELLAGCGWDPETAA